MNYYFFGFMGWFLVMWSVDGVKLYTWGLLFIFLHENIIFKFFFLRIIEDCLKFFDFLEKIIFLIRNTILNAFYLWNYIKLFIYYSHVLVTVITVRTIQMSPRMNPLQSHNHNPFSRASTTLLLPGFSPSSPGKRIIGFMR